MSGKTDEGHPDCFRLELGGLGARPPPLGGEVCVCIIHPLATRGTQ